MRKGSSKHQKIKQIIFHVNDQKIVYLLDKEGRHLQKMDRAKRTNYKKNDNQSNSEEEQQSNASVSSYESEADSQISSPETNVHSINSFEETTMTVNNSFYETFNNLEIPIQNPTFNINIENDCTNPDFWSHIEIGNTAIFENFRSLDPLTVLDCRLDNFENNLLDDDNCFVNPL